MVTIRSSIEELDQVDSAGNLTPISGIYISPAPLGRSDTLAVKIKVKMDTPSSDVAFGLVIDNRNFYSFDDNGSEMSQLFPKVPRNSVINFKFKIKNKAKLIGYNLIIYVKTKSTDPSAYYFSSDPMSYPVTYK